MHISLLLVLRSRYGFQWRLILITKYLKRNNYKLWGSFCLIGYFLNESGPHLPVTRKDIATVATARHNACL